MSSENTWETLASETHFENKNLSVVTEKVRTPSRPQGKEWTIVRRKTAAMIAALTSDRELLLIRQERIPIGAAIWEVPGGQIDQAKDDAGDVALRELREETGYELTSDGKLIPLGDFFSSPGFTDEHSYFFLASPVAPGIHGPARDESESILDCRAFPLTEIARMIADNEIRDANTLGICARLAARGFFAFPAAQ